MLPTRCQSVPVSSTQGPGSGPRTSLLTLAFTLSLSLVLVRYIFTFIAIGGERNIRSDIVHDRGGSRFVKWKCLHVISSFVISCQILAPTSYTRVCRVIIRSPKSVYVRLSSSINKFRRVSLDRSRLHTTRLPPTKRHLGGNLSTVQNYGDPGNNLKRAMYYKFEL